MQFYAQNRGLTNVSFPKQLDSVPLSLVEMEKNLLTSVKTEIIVSKILQHIISSCL